MVAEKAQAKPKASPKVGDLVHAVGNPAGEYLLVVKSDDATVTVAVLETFTIPRDNVEQV